MTAARTLFLPRLVDLILFTWSDRALMVLLSTPKGFSSDATVVVLLNCTSAFGFAKLASRRAVSATRSNAGSIGLPTIVPNLFTTQS